MGDGGIQGVGHLLRPVGRGAVAPSEREEHLRRQTLTLFAAIIVALTPLWIATYLLIDRPLSAAIPFAYAVLSIASLTQRTRRFSLFRTVQLTLMLVLPFALQWSLGGFQASSAVSVWALTSPLGALMFVGPRRAAPWFAAFAALLLFSGLVDPVVSRSPADVPDTIRIGFSVANIAGVSVAAYFALRHFVFEREEALRLLDLEHQRSERLLLNVLPEPVATRLKDRPELIADRFDEVTVLFADIVDFTPASALLSAEQVVDVLNEAFSTFDLLADRLDLEKIKTIGDAYMVAAGVPVPREDHVEAVAEMALEMLAAISGRTMRDGLPLRLRIGMDTGPVVAGVIGTRRFIYDLWGDTVNTASRMESHGVPGAIQVTRRVFERLRDAYRLEPRGKLEVKGKGEMETWLLLGRRDGVGIARAIAGGRGADPTGWNAR